jgi:adenylylsulfate kinase-like enzyme
MNNQGVVWLTGLSGAGKTTVAQLLRGRLMTEGICPVMLDGDRLRRIYPTEFGYSVEERRQLAASYGRLALEIASQGHLVICSTISLFREIHRWNRAHLPNYLEVWLRVPLEEIRRRDTRGIYVTQHDRHSPVVGVDLVVEFPEAPDLIIDNFGAVTPERAVEGIMERIEKAKES